MQDKDQHRTYESEKPEFMIKLTIIQVDKHVPETD